MKMPKNFKVFYYMYKLNINNLKSYMKPVLEPKKQPVTTNSIHWVGHATVIINLYGKIIVTDPVLGNLGYIKRLVKPSIDVTKIKADYIIISHEHMDHLNYNVLMRMNKDAIIIVPRGIKKILKFIGFKKIIQLKGGEKYIDNFVKISCITANHDGRRYWRFGYKDSNSYVICRNDKSVLFTGDTAFTERYKDIFADAAIMPVGCYKPDEYLNIHCSPEQSFKMFKMSKCHIMIPVHYKTYILAQDNDNETLKILHGLNDGSIKVIDVGETVNI